MSLMKTWGEWEYKDEEDDLSIEELREKHPDIEWVETPDGIGWKSKKTVSFQQLMEKVPFWKEGEQERWEKGE